MPDPPVHGDLRDPKAPREIRERRALREIEDCKDRQRIFLQR
jgi:hypothetical protein